MGIWMKLIKAIAKQASAPKKRTPSRLPERYKDLKKGFYWGGPSVTALASGQGFNHPIVGESFYHANLEQITGGPTQFGVNVSSVAHLREGEYEGAPSVEVFINGKRCGSLPAADAHDFIQEMQPLLALGKPLAAKANISAGYEGGHYSVSLSLARPLRQRL